MITFDGNGRREQHPPEDSFDRVVSDEVRRAAVTPQQSVMTLFLQLLFLIFQQTTVSFDSAMMNSMVELMPPLTSTQRCDWFCQCLLVALCDANPVLQVNGLESGCLEDEFENEIQRAMQVGFVATGSTTC